MTSIILMQKLLTMKLDKTEFDRIIFQQANISRKKRKVINPLKEILLKQAPETCRLCLKPGGMRIFGGDQEFDVATNIRFILGIEITEGDGKPQHICEECEHTVRQAARLKQTAETTQWRLQQELEMVADTVSEWSEEMDRHGGYFKTLDSGVAREWVCGKCHTAFQTQEQFREHGARASCRAPPRCYMCESCGLALKTMSRLKRHRLTHSGARPFPCASCAYRARSAHALAVHARVHSGARPARCALCAASFASASNLASHRRTHLPPRFACPACRRGFKFKAALNNHIATQHSNVKPFNCNICAKAFATRKMILRHELKAHNRPKMRPGVLPNYIRLQEES